MNLRRIVCLCVCLIVWSVGYEPLYAAQALKDLPFVSSLAPSSLEKEGAKSDHIRQSELIQMLEDPEKRGLFLQHLKTLNDITDQGEGVQGEETIIHDLNEKLVTHVESWAEQLIKGIRTLAHFPTSVWSSLKSLDSTEIQANILSFCILSLLAFIVGYVCELITMKLLLRMPFARSALHNKKQRLRLFIVQLLPLLAFLIGNYMFLEVVENPYTHATLIPVIEDMMEDIVLMRFILMLIRFCIHPISAPLQMSSRTRHIHRLYRFAAMFQYVVIFGLIVLALFTVLEVSHVARHTWQSIVGFGLSVFVSSVIVEYRRLVTRKIRIWQLKHMEWTHSFSVLPRFFARFWHIFAILCVFSVFLGWVYDHINDMIGLTRSIIGTILLWSAWYYSFKYCNVLRHKWSGSSHDILEDSSTTTLLTISDPLSFAKAVPLSQSAYFIMPLLQFLITVSAIVLTFELWGVSFMTFINTPRTQEYVLTLLSLVFILGGVRVAFGLIDLVAHTQLHPISRQGHTIEPSHFVQTITPIARSTAKVAAFILGLLLLLSELSVDIKPILYAFSLLILAIGLGAQTMIKDILTGFVTLLEGNIQVGEFVSIGEHSGIVEAITLRSVFLRHSNGGIQTIPFSEVRHITNRSRDFTLHTMHFSVARSTTLDDMTRVLKDAFQEIQKSARFGSSILEPMSMGGVTQLSDSGMTVTVYVRTRPDPKGGFQRAFQTIAQEHMRQNHIQPPIQSLMNFDAPSP